MTIYNCFVATKVAPRNDKLLVHTSLRDHVSGRGNPFLNFPGLLRRLIYLLAMTE
ncbi:hypothetical protein [Candidatus Tisiphia endosymbiont of Hybos culiciformis]|uniref:hypothetical protein n=1 Tax=Candidatus Tisiphia endosymbiont of Hybos culiciformis TaxID=3139331 RepID=UPI003CCACFAE